MSFQCVWQSVITNSLISTRIFSRAEHDHRLALSFLLYGGGMTDRLRANEKNNHIYKSIP